MRKLLCRTLPVVAALALAQGAAASVALKLSVEALTARADLVARGTVLAQSSAWTRGGRIVTTSKLQLDHALKGHAPDPVIDVRTLGGHVGDLGQQVEGEASFAPGESVVVFLKAHPTARGTYRVVGMSQGVFHLRAAGAVVRAAQDLRGLGRMSGPGSAISDGDGTPVSLSALESRVRAAAAR